MAIAASNFTNTKKVGQTTSSATVRGKFTGPSSYTSGGETVTLALGKSAFRGLTAIDSITFSPGFSTGSTAGVIAVWDNNPTAGSDFGKIHFLNTGQTAHSHQLGPTSGGVTLGTGALGIVNGKLSDAGSALTVAAGDATGIQNSSATVAGSEVAGATDLSGYVFNFTVIGR